LIEDLIISMLWSLSPFGEAKVGIPYGMLKGHNIYVVFLVCFVANAMVFPMVIFFLEKVNRFFTKWKFYKKSAIFIARRAKNGSGRNIQKFGFLGLVLFVMIPLPGTGVYAGSIASYLFKIERKRAFLANTIGIFFSSVIIWLATLLSMQGI